MEGRSATWDITVTNKDAASYVLAITSARAAEAAAQRKEIVLCCVMVHYLSTKPFKQTPMQR